MNTNQKTMVENLLYPDISYRVVGLAMDVHNKLKSQDAITNANRAQTLNYLKATGYKLAIILNFGKTRLQSERLAN
jgi:PD-(D/E)XK nuclease superfamily